jgi:hypothetical protein
MPVGAPTWANVNAQHMKPYFQIQGATTGFIHRFICDFVTMPNPISTDIVAGIVIKAFDSVGGKIYYFVVYDVSPFYKGPAPPNDVFTHYMLACTIAPF